MRVPSRGSERERPVLCCFPPANAERRGGEIVPVPLFRLLHCLVSVRLPDADDHSRQPEMVDGMYYLLAIEKHSMYVWLPLKGKRIMAQISFRLDDRLKKAAEETFHSMGMTMTAAIHIFIVQTVLEGRLPFLVKADRVHPVHGGVSAGDNPKETP